MSGQQPKNDEALEGLNERRAKRAAKGVHYPIVLAGNAPRRALIVGGGSVAERKARALLDGGIEVTILSPHVTPGLQMLWVRKKIQFLLGIFPDQCPQLKDFDLILAASDDRAVNAAVGEQARAAGRLVNLADDPENSDFYTPAVARDERLGVTVAVSTRGSSPRLARAWRERITRLLSTTTNEEVEAEEELKQEKESEP